MLRTDSEIMNQRTTHRERGGEEAINRWDVVISGIISVVLLLCCGWIHSCDYDVAVLYTGL